MGEVIVFVEQREGQLKRASLEALEAGRQLAEKTGSQLNALLIGHNIESLAGTLNCYSINKILLAEHQSLERYNNSLYTHILYQEAQKRGALAILFSATAMGRDLASRLAARLSGLLLTECTSVEVTDGLLEVTRPVYAGKLLARTRSLLPQFQVITLRSNVFPVAQKITEKATVERVDTSALPKEPLAILKDVIYTKGFKMDITEARVVVGGGRGLKGAENFKLLEELAEFFGGVVAASRAVVDAGWKPPEIQVGLTGKTISPELYIACGVSGSAQHLAGILGAKYIVAINKDHDAPIFKVADLGLVGDLFQVVPALIKQLKDLK